MSSWHTQAFLNKTTSRPLKWTVLGAFFMVGLVGVLISTVRINQTISVLGELRTSQGSKDIVAGDEGYIRLGYYQIGDTVEKDAILARISIPQTTHESVAKVLAQVSSLHQKYAKGERPEAQEILSISSDNVTITDHLDRIKKDFKVYQSTVDENLRLISKKVTWFRERREKEEEKLRVLSSSSPSGLLQSTIFDTKEKIREFSESEYELSDEIDRKTQIARNAWIETLRREYLAIFEFYESHLVKASSRGIIARKAVSDQKWVRKGEELYSIVPIQDQYVAILKVSNESIGKIRLAQDVLTAVDAYSYQRYGQYLGKVKAINQLVSKEGSYFEVEATLVKREGAFSNRAIASDIPLFPGMTVQSFIVLEKQTILNSLLEKLFYKKSW